MRSVLALSLLLGACNSFSAVDSSDGGPNADANPSAPDADPNAPDADPNAPDAGSCADWARTPSLFDPCLDITEEINDLILTSAGTYLYNTDAGTLTDPVGAVVAHTSALIGENRAMVVGSLTIGSATNLRATGSRPLLIVSWSTIHIDGKIDVSSNLSAPGAGANSAQCNAAANGGNAQQGGGGGGGGGFGASGSSGGDGNNGNTPGGSGSTAIAQAFHGGCQGGAGGLGDGEPGGSGGAGGGALFLSARSTLTMGGVLHAGGGGGAGAQGGRAAGGGGGSGGFLGLEAAMLELQVGGILAANGGGGGGGSNTGAPAQPGEAGGPSGSAAPGGLGTNSPKGNGGGGGFVVDVDGQAGAEGDRGGGGGGGSVGYIQLSANSITNNAAVISPAQSP